MAILFLIVGLVLGTLIGKFLLSKGNKSDATELEKTIAILNSENGNLKLNVDTLQKNLKDIELKNSRAYEDLIEKEKLISKYQQQYESSVLQLNEEKLRNQETASLLKKEYITNLDNLSKSWNTEREVLVSTLENRFKVFVNDLSKASQDDLKKSNVESLKTILAPIESFNLTVKESIEKNVELKSSLETQYKNLMSTANSVSASANNLTDALRGNKKILGNWGENILNKILEDSGLILGTHYEVQVSGKNEDGDTLRPDVVVFLPEDKFLIIDSKVSLINYHNYFNATDEPTMAVELKKLADCLAQHANGLSRKDYTTISGLSVPDHILMFVPLEASYSAALSVNPSLFESAFTNKVVIVTPTTLVSTLMVIAQIWRQNAQMLNVEQIAEAGSKVVDKLINGMESFQNVANSLNKAKEAYDKAEGQLFTGRGNLKSIASNLTALGVKAKGKIVANIEDLDSLNDIQKLNQTL